MPRVVPAPNSLWLIEPSPSLSSLPITYLAISEFPLPKALFRSVLVTFPSPSASSSPNTFCCIGESPPLLDASCALISALIAPRLNGGPEPPPDGCVWPLLPEKGSSPNDIGSLALGCAVGAVLNCCTD